MLHGVCSIVSRMPRPLGFGTSTRALALPRHTVVWCGLTVLHRLHRQPSIRRASGLFLLVAT